MHIYDTFYRYGRTFDSAAYLLVRCCDSVLGLRFYYDLRFRCRLIYTTHVTTPHGTVLSRTFTTFGDWSRSPIWTTFHSPRSHTLPFEFTTTFTFTRPHARRSGRDVRVAVILRFTFTSPLYATFSDNLLFIYSVPVDPAPRYRHTFPVVVLLALPTFPSSYVVGDHVTFHTRCLPHRWVTVYLAFVLRSTPYTTFTDLLTTHHRCLHTCLPACDQYLTVHSLPVTVEGGGLFRLRFRYMPTLLYDRCC